MRVFEIPSGKLLKSFEGHTQHVLDVGWSPDGKRAGRAGADDLIKIWNYETGEKVRDLKGTTKQVTRLAFVGKTPNFFTVGGDAVARRWNVENGDPSRAISDAKDFLYAVSANADGSLVATGGEEGIVHLRRQIGKGTEGGDAEVELDFSRSLLNQRAFIRTTDCR